MTPGERYHTQLVRVVAPHFVAGLLFDTTTDRCFLTAPILWRCRYKSGAELRSYFKRKGWRAAIVSVPFDAKAEEHELIMVKPDRPLDLRHDE